MFPVHAASVSKAMALGATFGTALPAAGAIVDKKCSTSKGTSSRRSVRDGTWIGTTANRWNKSSRNSPLAMASFRFLLVAAKPAR